MRYCHSLTFSITNFSIFPFLVSRSFCSKARANRYASLLQLCCLQSPISCSFACAVHAHMIASGFKPRGHILNRLINICSKSSKLAYARHLFDEIPQPDIVAREFFDGGGMCEERVVAWNTMISGYRYHGLYKEALGIFRKMHLSGMRLDEYTYTSIIRVCEKAGFYQLGKELHAYILKTEVNPSPDFSLRVNKALMTLYWRCGRVDEAREIFNYMPMKKRDTVFYTAMITAYSHNNDGHAAIELFRDMRRNDFSPNNFTFTSVIGALCHVHNSSRMP